MRKSLLCCKQSFLFCNRSGIVNYLCSEERPWEQTASSLFTLIGFETMPGEKRSWAQVYLVVVPCKKIPRSCMGWGIWYVSLNIQVLGTEGSRVEKRRLQHAAPSESSSRLNSLGKRTCCRSLYHLHPKIYGELPHAAFENHCLFW